MPDMRHDVHTTLKYAFIVIATLTLAPYQTTLFVPLAFSTYGLKTHSTAHGDHYLDPGLWTGLISGDIH